VATEIDTNLNSTNFGADGVLGMGFSGLSPFNALFNASTVLEKLVDGGQLPEPVFGLVLAESNSELIIGGRNSSRYKGDLVYTAVNGSTVRISRGPPCLHFNTDTIQGYWQTRLDNITINGNDTQISTTEAIIDTGNSLILGDQISIANIYAAIPGSSRMNDSDLWTCTFVTELTVRVAN
jgi:cathepsin D